MMLQNFVGQWALRAQCLSEYRAVRESCVLQSCCGAGHVGHFRAALCRGHVLSLIHISEPTRLALI
eukprot:5579045-Alexandrium_andersonii.AAC.1